jgi:hypothetical protein
MQILTDARIMDDGAGRAPGADPTAVGAVLTAGRMADRLVRKGLVRRHRARGDRRVVLVSVTPAGRQVVGEATRRRRALIADILARLPADAQRAVAGAFREFADAAGEVPDSRWPAAVPAGEGPGPRRRAPAQPGGQGQQALPPAAV